MSETASTLSWMAGHQNWSTSTDCTVEINQIFGLLARCFSLYESIMIQEYVMSLKHHNPCKHG